IGRLNCQLSHSFGCSNKFTINTNFVFCTLFGHSVFRACDQKLAKRRRKLNDFLVRGSPHSYPACFLPCERISLTASTSSKGKHSSLRKNHQFVSPANFSLTS